MSGEFSCHRLQSQNVQRVRKLAAAVRMVKALRAKPGYHSTGNPLPRRGDLAGPR